MDGTQTKVVALNGSARKGGNTAILLRYVLKELEQEGIETELIELSGAKIHGCLACRKCSARKDRRCSQTGDMGNVYIEKMEAADGILLGSPTYVADISPEIKAVMDRACLVSKANGGMFRRKVGAAVVAPACRRAFPRRWKSPVVASPCEYQSSMSRAFRTPMLKGPPSWRPEGATHCALPAHPELTSGGIILLRCWVDSSCSHPECRRRSRWLGNRPGG